jgi:hypothetical protein
MKTQTAQTFDRRSMLVGSLITGAGIFAGTRSLVSIQSAGTVMAQDVNAEATSTREAELEELSAMRTALAASPECDLDATPIPEPTPTMPPPVPAGTEVPLDGSLYLTVQSLAPMIAPPDMKLQGLLLQLNFSVRNESTDTIKLKFLDFQLESVSGTVVRLDPNLNSKLFGSEIALGIRGNTSKNLSAAFDFPDPSATKFILTNSSYPELRVSVEIIQRG